MYDITGAASDRNCVVLNDIHIDIMDYIVPATCTDTEFRQMWAEFEWENKVAVNTNVSNLHDYLQLLLGCTNMRCLTPEKVRKLGSMSGVRGRFRSIHASSVQVYSSFRLFDPFDDGFGAKEKTVISG